jgi:DNA-binding NarL/FixJ family response regulator
MPRLSNIPVIVLSAQQRSLSEQPALDAGAAAFFQKSADPEELLKKIRELVGET